MAAIKKLETALVPYFIPQMIATIFASIFVALLLRVRFRPGLRNIPGPFLASFTPFDRLWTAISGHAFLFHLDYHRKYGPLVRLGPNHVSIADSQYIPLVYGIASKFYKSEFYSVFDVNTDKGPVPTTFSIRNEAAHTVLKRPVAHAYAMSSLLELEPMADECCRIFEEKLDAMQDKPFDLGVWLQWYAFDVISSITFSNRFDFMKNEEDVAGIISAIEGRLIYNSVIGQVPSLHPWLLGNPLVARIATVIPGIARLASARYLSSFSKKQLDRYRSADPSSFKYRDMLARFKRTVNDNVVMTDSELLSHATGNILAGSDTTAISLRSLFYYLNKHPRCMKKVVEEIDEADSKGELSPFVTFAEGNRLKYFQACMKEALRMHPAVGLLLERVVPEGGANFGNVYLPAGTVVGMNPWVLGYDKKVYGEDVDVYRPERWLEADRETYKLMDRNYFAFGSGARTCLGKNVSLMEMSKLVPQLVRDYTFELADPKSQWELHDFWFVKQTNLIFCNVNISPQITPGNVVRNATGKDDAVQTVCVIEREGSGNPEDAEDAIDGMAAVTFAPESDCAFFGPSSNIALLRDISQAVASMDNTRNPWMPSPLVGNPAPSREGQDQTATCLQMPPTPASLRYSFSDPYSVGSVIPVEEKINIYALPSERHAQELMHRYFANTGQMFPFIHEKTFSNTYNQVKRDGFRGVRRIWLGLLNMVFAMATSVSLSPDSQGPVAGQRTAESEVYYRRASGLCSEQIALGRGMSLDAVHYLILLEQYLQGTQRSAQTWITHSLAAKVALQLGLHSSEASRRFTPIEREVRKRTWYICVILDRSLSMTFGRPLAISESQVKLELPQPYSSIAPSSSGRGLDDLSVSFFNSTITLYRVMSSIIDLLYGQNIGCGDSVTDAEKVARIFRIEDQLSEWRRTNCRPDLIMAADLADASMLAEAATLAAPSDKKEGSIPPNWWSVYELRLRVVITLRYNNLRILLHRPILTSLLTPLNDAGSDTNDVSIIQQIGANIHSTGPSRGLLGAWWWSLYYTFNAALVIVASVIISLRDDQSSAVMGYNEESDKYLGQAIQSLRNLDSGNRMVARCREYLEQLVRVLESRLSNSGNTLSSARVTDKHIVHQNGQSMPSQTNDITSRPFLGADLTEFLMDDDLSFQTDHMFSFGQETVDPLLGLTWTG
ncbi:putative P450 monooxygenase [Paecilomyces variotii No. 5]|uniref:Putative P450 monooxygenase n=1 Tax=Byssochlamys spectabilis (strain No. 5 / NBRC 109023) TaxID=1356009 RepID=V5G4U8_BYSSN|nr:putative P450 monooxygenase [Paecilomyces variotii No. 5]